MARFKQNFFFLFFFVVFINTPCLPKTRTKKPWTFIIFAAADNNLRDFAPRNINQMARVGSNQNINILVHVDIRLQGSKKTSRRYYVEKNNPVQIEITNEKLPMDSGDPQTLISACKWAFTEYPAERYALILWDHGTGIIDPYGRRHLNTNELFHLNPLTNNYELDRTIGFLELIEELNYDPKGICWDDSTGQYLTNQKLEFALNEITSNIIHKKLDILAFDACLMSMLEVAEISKRYANIQVSSQEVEPGPGWQYDQVFAPFSRTSLEPRDLAKHIVDAFANAYKPTGNSPGFIDFTQSAIDLTMLNKLEENVDLLAQILVLAIQSEHAQLFKNVILNSRSKKNCTHFNEPSYIDLHHFYTNLQKNLKDLITFPNSLASHLQKITKEGLQIFKDVVIHNVNGSNLPQAHGISIFFPERKIHASYKKTNFAKNNWLNFLTTFLLA